jgi:predicted dehydrogenase
MTRLAIIGTGWWAGVHAGEFSRDPRVKIVAVCGTSEEKAAAFAKERGIPRSYADFEALLADGEVDAVAVVTPDKTHCAFATRALEAGLHVLCEKPLAFTLEEAGRMAAAAAKSGRVNMVNFSYRKSAALAKAEQMVKDGELGRIFHAEARYLQSWLLAKDMGDWRTESKWLWRLSTAHGSKGALGDTGVHILDFATLPLGPVKNLGCRLKTFDKTPGNRIGQYSIDANDSALIDIEFENGALCNISVTRLAIGRPNKVALEIYGEKAALSIDLDKGWDVLEVARLDAQDKQLPWERVECPPQRSIYERFMDGIENGTNPQPDFARGLEIQGLLDACERDAKKNSK